MNKNDMKLTAPPQPLNTRERWVLLAPRGDHPHEHGIQRVDEESLQCLVRSFHGLLGTLKRALVGCSLYRGHPDTPELSGRYPDHNTYGVVNELEARPAGLYARITLTEPGARLVQAGIRWLSPYWKAQEIQTTEDGTKIYRPLQLLSVGLTAQPNIPGEALANTRGPSWRGALKTKPLTQELRAHYPCTLRALHGQGEIRAFIQEKCSAGHSYDEAFGFLLPR